MAVLSNNGAPTRSGGGPNTGTAGMGGGSARQNSQGTPKAAVSPCSHSRSEGGTAPRGAPSHSGCGMTLVAGSCYGARLRTGRILEYDASQPGRHLRFGSAAPCSQHPCLPARYAGRSPNSTPPAPRVCHGHRVEGMCIMYTSHNEGSRADQCRLEDPGWDLLDVRNGAQGCKATTTRRTLETTGYFCRKTMPMVLRR